MAGTHGSLAAAPSSPANFWGGSRIAPLLPQHDAPAFPRPRHVYHALVRRAAEPRRRVAQFMHVSSVNQYIASGQQSHNIAVIAANQFLVREARVRHHVPAEPSSCERDLGELAGLRERLAAGKRNPASCLFVLPQHARDLARGKFLPGAGVPGPRVLAVRALVRAALGEDDVAQPGTVNKTFRSDARQAHRLSARAYRS